MPWTTHQKDEFKRTVGKRVKETREAQRLSVADVARRADIPRQYIYDLEGGIRVSVANVVNAARALGTSVDYLLGLSEHRGAAHHCCEVAADRDAFTRFAQGPDRWLVPQEDGSYQPFDVTPGAPLPAMKVWKGRTVELIACGVYRWEGHVYRVGQVD